MTCRVHPNVRSHARSAHSDPVAIGDGRPAARAANVYPLGWEEPACLEWGRDRFEALVVFLDAAAASGDAVPAWLA
ncbi:hypothetical protein [Embleya sp. MST-111070]|uniref:hypothetical protein n=1 Tax=Embleya sp. MST-111070 TaxID=3398231 RepID=UPI003F736666